jgi:hypothetical protein
MSWRFRLLLIAAATVAIGGCSSTETPLEQPPGFVPGVLANGVVCQASEQAFVKRALHEVWGRKPRSIREVSILEDLATQLGRAELGRAKLVRLMTRSPEYVARWSHVIRDLLFINRVGERMHDECNISRFNADDRGQLATFVRDTAPGGAPAATPFTMLDLLESSLWLDDLSPVLRAQPFEMVASRLHRADQDQHELAFRKLYADLFERNYLNRRMECLRCHNTEFSVTPIYPAAGLVDRAVFGQPDGLAISELMPFFRIRGVLAMDFDETTDPYWFYGQGLAPWGWADGCGQFVPPAEITPDPLSETAWLAGDASEQASVWALEERLQAGLEALRGTPPQGADVDASQALAWMVSLRLAEGIWQRVTGMPLTVAHYFPRNPWQGALLQHLAEGFVTEGFSVREVLVRTLTHPYVVQSNMTQCGEDYWMAPIFDPWTTENDDPITQRNTLGDMTGRSAPRVLMHSVVEALGWTPTHVLADENGIFDDLVDLHIDLGLFVMDGETGFRGANLREALAWEEAYGLCRDPFAEVQGAPDWIDALVAAAQGQTLEAAVVALKDRLVTEPDLSDPSERALIEALLGQPLSTTISEKTDDADAGLRRVCAAILSSPQFTMTGAPAPDRTDLDLSVTVPGSSPAELCTSLKAALYPEGGAACINGALVPSESAP